MIEIDGREAGGQVLRTALGLSAVTGNPIRVVNIRAARQGGTGLKTQHLEGVKAVAQLCNAEVKGDKLGSGELEFIPGKLEPKKLNINIGTAGSIALLFQSLQMASAFAGSTVNINVKGGSTASLWSPVLHYTKNVFLPVVATMGYKAEINILEEGFYPKGGARVEIEVHPAKLKPVSLTERKDVKVIHGVSVVGSLPMHAAKRQAAGARKVLALHGYDVKIEEKIVNSLSPGTSLTLWADCGNTVLGADSTGEKGKPAEKVGEEVARGLVKSIESGAPVDKYMSDQVIPFLALAGKSEVKIEEFTDHCKTNLEVTEKVLGVKFEVDRENMMIRIM